MASPDPLRFDVTILRAPALRSRGLSRRSLAMTSVACALVALVPVAASRGAQAFLTCASGVMLALAFGVVRPDPVGRATADVSDDALTLSLDGERVELPWSGVLRHAVRPSDDGDDTLTLECEDGGVWTLRLSEEAMTAAVDALRRAVQRRALTVPLQGRLEASGWTALVVMLSLVAPMPLADAVSHSGGTLAGLLTWLAGFAVAARLVRELCVSRVTVGDDGVSIQNMGCERFLPWSFVDDLDWDEYGVVLRLVDGEEVSLPVLSGAMVRDVRDASVARAIGLRDALHERLRAGLDAWRWRRETPEDMAALLDRQGRSLEDWRASVRALADSMHGYRDMRLDARVAARVLDDPTAPLERRVAAVWALHDHDHARASTRVRVALDAAVSEPVRAALEQAARGYLDEDALSRALDLAEH